MTEETQPMTPEMNSYTVTATRRFEVDFSQQQVENMKQKTGEDDPIDAIQKALFQPEIQHIQPEHKLISVDLQVDESSDD